MGASFRDAFGRNTANGPLLLVDFQPRLGLQLGHPTVLSEQEWSRQGPSN